MEPDLFYACRVRVEKNAGYAYVVFQGSELAGRLDVDVEPEDYVSLAVTAIVAWREPTGVQHTSHFASASRMRSGVISAVSLDTSKVGK